MTCFFTTLIGALVGLRSASASSIDLVTAYGGGQWAIMRKVRMKSSLPALFAGLRIAGPAAVLGAIIGEFIGGSENGLGVALVAARANADSARVWGVALVATAVAGLGYALIALVGRLLTPWAPSARRSGT
jgi:ABC-type nitrate/sulfonate/bicarbonate transport system permease component